MPTAAPDVTPLERSALIAAYQAPGHRLPRMGSGFVAAPVHRPHSGPTLVHSVTKRMALRLQRADLVQLDDEHCPRSMTLTDDGIALARQLLEAANEAAR